MIIKKSQIIRIIKEALDNAPERYTLPDGRDVKYASEDHIKYIQDTLDVLARMRDESPRASRGGYRSSSRSAYNMAIGERRKDLQDALKLAELLMNEENEENEIEEEVEELDPDVIIGEEEEFEFDD